MISRLLTGRTWDASTVATAAPRQVLDYVGRYTHRLAISNHRLLAIDDDLVQFRYKDYRDPAAQKTMTLTAADFIRRFLVHVLPAGFQRVRYFGFLGNRYRRAKLTRCRQLLGMPTPAPTPGDARPSHEYRDVYERLTGTSLRICPVCREGHMLVIDQIVALTQPQIPDSS